MAAGKNNSLYSTDYTVERNAVFQLRQQCLWYVVAHYHTMTVNWFQKFMSRREGGQLRNWPLLF